MSSEVTELEVRVAELEEQFDLSKAVIAKLILRLVSTDQGHFGRELPENTAMRMWPGFYEDLHGEHSDDCEQLGPVNCMKCRAERFLVRAEELVRKEMPDEQDGT